MAETPPSLPDAEAGEPDSPVSMAADRRLSALASGAKYRAMSPARLPITRREPCLTIPPGFSPSSLLESPVLLTNLKVEPSPTTGTINMSSFMNKTIYESLSSLRESSVSNDCGIGRSNSNEFEFKIPQRSSFQSAVSSSCDLPMQESSAQNQHQIFTPSTIHVVSHCNSQSSQELPLTGNDLSASHLAEQNGSSDGTHAEISIAEFQRANDAEKTTQEIQADLTDANALNIAEKSADDGYNWRKYGQKHVKGCENPRSYYKCTHPSCEVKKLLERSNDGQITDIVYKGEHNHPKPQPNRRIAVGSAVSSQGEEKYDNMQTTSEDRPPSMLSHGPLINVVGAAEVLPGSMSDDEFDMEGRSANACDGNADDDDLDSKRRKVDLPGLDAALLGKPNREPRVVVQTVSEVDILDDGYRWRKYGQKVVKGNPNPRSYYKCTYIGCPVRKHVERASHDPKSVITTYEGKHNHEVPSSRTSGNEMSASAAKNMAVSINNSMPPQALDGVLRACDTRALGNHFAQATENGMISLDLGVGTSLNPSANAANQMQTVQPSVQEQIRYHEMQALRSIYSNTGNPSIQMPTVPTNPGGNIFYELREGRTEGFSFKAGPLDQSTTNLCFDNSTGNVVFGP